MWEGGRGLITLILNKEGGSLAINMVCRGGGAKRNFDLCHILLVFIVTPFKIDQNKNQNRSIDKVQNLGNIRR